MTDLIIPEVEEEEQEKSLFSIMDEYGYIPEIEEGLPGALTFTIKCINPKDIEMLKQWLKIETNSISYEDFKKIVHSRGWI